MPPMTRSFSPNGIPGDSVAEYYRRRAEGGTGLIISEGTLIDHPASTDTTDNPKFHGEASLAGWKKVVDAVHAGRWQDDASNMAYRLGSSCRDRICSGRCQCLLHPA